MIDVQCKSRRARFQAQDYIALQYELSNDSATEIGESQKTASYGNED